MVTDNNNNRNSYFRIQYEFENAKKIKLAPEPLMAALEDKIDIILTKLGATNECFTVFDQTNPYTLELLFKVQSRKRLGVVRNQLYKIIKTFNQTYFNQLTNERERLIYATENIDNPILHDCSAYTKSSFYNRLDYLQKNRDYYLKSDVTKYNGDDIQVFKEESNYYSWQKKLYNLLYDEKGNIRPADHREIVYICDQSGNTGKSSFLKHLYVNHSRDIYFLAEANAAQLKSAIIATGERPIYILDLPRTRSKQGATDLCNVIEQLKSGFLIDNLYGKANNMLSNPVHVIVVGNEMPTGALSPDRWKVFKLFKKKNDIDWVDISSEIQAKATFEIELNNKIKALADIERLVKVEKKLEKYKEKNFLKKHPRLEAVLKELETSSK